MFFLLSDAVSSHYLFNEYIYYVKRMTAYFFCRIVVVSGAFLIILI